MMKKRIFPVILAFALILSCIVPAFASAPQTYDVTIRYDDDHGTFTLSSDTAKAGESVYIYADPDNGYEVGSVVVRNETTGASTNARGNVNGVDFYFIMPDSDVTIEATFVRDRDGSSTRYYVDVDYNTRYGNVDVSSTRATANSLVYITAEPNSGYVVDDVIITADDGSDVRVFTSTSSTLGDYYFRMPDDHVLVEVVFTRQGTSSNTYYDIDAVYDDDLGYVDLSDDSAKPGTRVYVYPEPDRGYEVYEIFATQVSDGAEVTLTARNDYYYFTMPDTDVVIEVVFADDDDYSSSSPSGTKYDVTLDYEDAYGDVSVSKTRATSGTKVYIYADPNTGYAVDDIIVTKDTNGAEITVRQSSGDYYFNMPSTDVTVEVIFADEDDVDSDEYAVDLYYDDRYGYAEVSDDTAVYGTKVYVWAESDDGYELDEIEVTRISNGASVTVRGSGDEYYFTMPADDVAVDVIFTDEDYVSSTRKYDIELDYDDTYGYVSLSKNTATSGSKIYIYADPDDGCEVDDVIVTRDSTGADVIVKQSGGDYYFTMPSGDVTVEVIFVDEEGGTSSSTSKYDIDLEYTSYYGDVELSKSRAASGTKVYVYTYPKGSNKVDDVIVTKNTNGAEVTVRQSSGDYYFTMPSCDVTVEVLFEGENSGTYAVSLEKYTNGEVLLSSGRADKGETVYVYTEPNEGYEVSSVEVTRASTGRMVTTVNNGDGSFSFIMPGGKVNVEVTFTKSASTGTDTPGTTTPSTPGTTTPGTEVIHICPARPYTDVDTTLWYHAAIDYVISNNLMNGYGNGKFGPYDVTSRAMITTIVWRLAGSPTSDAAITYTDVADGDWYADAVRWAAANGILTDVASGTVFAPDSSITREQFASMIYRYEKSIGGGFTGIWQYQLNFSDLNDLSYWAVEAVSWCNKEGILNGNGAGALNPKGEVTRAELAQIIMNYKNK